MMQANDAISDGASCVDVTSGGTSSDRASCVSTYVVGELLPEHIDLLGKHALVVCISSSTLEACKYVLKSTSAVVVADDRGPRGLVLSEIDSIVFNVISFDPDDWMDAKDNIYAWFYAVQRSSKVWPIPVMIACEAKQLHSLRGYFDSRMMHNANVVWQAS